MANVNSLTIGNTSLPVANSLASLSDVGTANTAEGNILTFNGTAWTNGTLTGNNGVSVSRNGVNYTLSGDASWTKTQAINAPLTGLDTSQGGAVTASDTVLRAIGKLALIQTVPPVSSFKVGYDANYNNGGGAAVISVGGTGVTFDVYISSAGLQIARIDSATGTVKWSSIAAQQ